MSHMMVCRVSGCSDTKSHRVSCADWACGISLCGSGLLARRGQKLRDGVLTQRGVVGLEVPVRTGTTSMHYPLRDALVVEVGDLLPSVKVLQQCWAALASAQCIVGVINPHTLLSCQESGCSIDSVTVELLLLRIGLVSPKFPLVG